MKPPALTRVADGVHFVNTGSANWTILTEGRSATLVDAGYPGDLPAVLWSLERLGHRPEDLAAVLVTHAHVDHIGSLPELLRRAPHAKVLTSAAEARHVRREFLEQATPFDVVANLWRPGFLPWALHIVRAGALRDVRVPAAEAFPAAGPLDVPGRPVPVPTPGHTSGHTCYHLPEAGALITGDTLVTAHPTSRSAGPQLLASLFHHDEPAVRAALDVLEPLPAGLLLPGHGPHLAASPADAVALVRAGRG
ncbi:MBL fold metallo-hydrolase [Actinocorallia libanotica]|uniref:MBL fold metallo-hydrolase n=1 Tax=Actinocorallia libanotica TaxID=46162 RepID=A0ABN1RW27_9ACTN